MGRFRAWHANVVGIVGNLGFGIVQAATGPAEAGALIFSVAFLAISIVGTAASIPATLLFALGRFRRIAAVLNVVVAIALAVVFSPLAMTFGVFLLVGAVLGWREAGQ